MLLPLLPLLFRYSASNSFWMAATFHFSPMNLLVDCCIKHSWSATFPWSATILHEKLQICEVLQKIRKTLQFCEAQQIREALQFREALQICEALQSRCRCLDLCLFPGEKNPGAHITVVWYNTSESIEWFLEGQAFVWFGSSPTPSPVSKFDRDTQEDWERETSCYWERGGRRKIKRQRWKPGPL